MNAQKQMKIGALMADLGQAMGVMSTMMSAEMDDKVDPQSLPSQQHLLELSMGQIQARIVHLCEIGVLDLNRIIAHAEIAHARS